MHYYPTDSVFDYYRSVLCVICSRPSCCVYCASPRSPVWHHTSKSHHRQTIWTLVQATQVSQICTLNGKQLHFYLTNIDHVLFQRLLLPSNEKFSVRHKRLCHKSMIMQRIRDDAELGRYLCTVKIHSRRWHRHNIVLKSWSCGIGYSMALAIN